MPGSTTVMPVAHCSHASRRPDHDDVSTAVDDLAPRRDVMAEIIPMAALELLLWPVTTSEFRYGRLIPTSLEGMACTIRRSS